MKGRVGRLAALLVTVAAAVVVSADITPDAAGMLLERGGGVKEVYIKNVFYSCVNGNDFAILENGVPENPADYDIVEAGGLTVYVPRSMSFGDNVPKIVVFPRRTGKRDVGAANVTS